MKNSNSTLSYIKTLSTLHYALFGGQVLMAGVMFFLKGSTVFHLSNSDGVFLYLVPILSVLGLFFGQKLYDSRIQQLKDETDLDEKLDKYRGAIIIRLTLIEGPALLGIMAYYITGNLLYLVIAAFLILYFFYLKPSMENIKSDLVLTKNELEHIKKDR